MAIKTGTIYAKDEVCPQCEMDTVWTDRVHELTQHLITAWIIETLFCCICEWRGLSRRRLVWTDEIKAS